MTPVSAPGATIRRKPVAKTAHPSAAASITPTAFAAATLLSTALFSWPLRWILSGAPLLVYSMLLGRSMGHRILPYIPLWTIFTTLNLVYAVAATSWLLYWVFAVACYITILLSCLFQFDMFSMFARRLFRRLLCDLHFIQDTISFFNLPALEIDKDVHGLMVIRGFTFSISTLTGTAHGVEVGIKFSDDMELAIQTDKVVVSLFRKIEISDVYCNVKGGEYEMTFGSFKPGPLAQPGEAFVVTDTPILKVAAASITQDSVETRTTLTDGNPPEDIVDTKTYRVIQLSPDEEAARERYLAKLRHISDTNTIKIATDALIKAAQVDKTNSNLNSDNNLRAAVCAHIHDQPSIPHPPKQSIRLSTLRHTSYPGVKRFIHRFPLLYRLLLSPISYFHPVSVTNVTAAGSGKWFVSLMQQYLFRSYAQDGEIRRLEARISAWLSDAYFAVELGPVHAKAHVPINTAYDIEHHFKIGDLMAYRTLPGAVNLTQVIRLGGADATIAIPSFLLPRHEHLLPPKPTDFDELNKEQDIINADGKPNTVQLKRELEQMQKDETNMRISAHAHLPAVFDQELLNFVAALVKATKIIEMEKDHEELKLRRSETLESEDEQRRSRTNSTASDTLSIASVETAESTTSTTSTMRPGSPKSLNNFIRKVDRGFKDINVKMGDGMRKAGVNTINAMANDRWIAKLVGNVMRKLENAQGDIGYSGLIPIGLAYYRERGEPDSKLLP